MSVTLAWLLPLLAGTAAWLALNPRRGPGWIAAALGHGTVFGILFAAAATALAARTDTARALMHAGPWLGAFTLLAGVVAWRRVRAAPPRGRTRTIGARATPPWIHAALGIAMASLIWRGWISLREILLRPTFPWDAWDAWAVKSKTWFLLGHYAPFVPMHQWLAQSGADAYTGVAWSYPPTLAWFQVWFASAAGGWIEPMVNLPWFALWLGLLLGHYGQWRALGLERVRALAAVYVLGSLPLIDVHVALAGYADLWVATVFGFGVLAWLRWIESGQRGQLIVAAVCAALLPMLKLEGGVWLLLFACVAAFGALSRRWRWYAIGFAALVLVLGVLFANLVLPLIAPGWTHASDGAVEVPVIGRLAIAWHEEAFTGVLRSLFAQRNWNLLWWLAPALVAWRWRHFRDAESLRLLGLLLVAALGFLLFLFLFTDAARWAESYTAINRLVMQVVPATITLLALLCRERSELAFLQSGGDLPAWEDEYRGMTAQGAG